MSEQLYRRTVAADADTWSVKVWNGLTNFYGSNVWSDGNNVYHSNGDRQYVLNKATSTWEPKTWNGALTTPSTLFIWSDGIDTYFSNGDRQYVLNKATSTWEPKTWNGAFTSPNGSCIWSDGEHIYYSEYDQYILNKATSTWEPKTWYGDLTTPNGSCIWTDGDNVYHSNENQHFVLDKSTNTWSYKDWGYNDPREASLIWSSNKNVYYGGIYSSTQYILNKATGEFNAKTWSGDLTVPNGSCIWSDGEHIYYSNASEQYVLDEIITYEPVTIPTSMKVKDRGGIWYPVKGVSVRTHGGSGAAEVKLDTKVPCLTANGEVIIMYDAEGNILAHKSDIENVAALTRFAMYELRNIYLGETCPFDTDAISAEQVSRIYVDGDGYLAYNDADDTAGENSRQMLEWNSLNEATIDFASIAGYPRYT